MGYNFGCMIASGTIFDSRGGFSGSCYRVKTADFRVLREVAIATNFGTKIAITGFVWTIATKLEVGLSGRPTKCIDDTLKLTDIAMATILWLSVYGVRIGVIWRIQLNRRCGLMSITLTTCYYWHKTIAHTPNKGLHQWTKRIWKVSSRYINN